MDENSQQETWNYLPEIINNDGKNNQLLGLDFTVWRSSLNAYGRLRKFSFSY